MKKKGNKRGRPAITSDDDIEKQLTKLSSPKKLRVVKNNKASRVYRRNVAQRRQAIDDKLKMEYLKFEQLKAYHTRLEQEIQKLRLELVTAAM